MNIANIAQEDAMAEAAIEAAEVDAEMRAHTPPSEIEKIISNLGPAMHTRRKEIGLSLQEVADAAGTSKSHIWALEQGDAKNPTISMLLSVSAALQTSINRLLGFDFGQPIITDAEFELISHHRRIFGGIES